MQQGVGARGLTRKSLVPHRSSPHQKTSLRGLVVCIYPSIFSNTLRAPPASAESYSKPFDPRARGILKSELATATAIHRSPLLVTKKHVECSYGSTLTTNLIKLATNLFMNAVQVFQTVGRVELLRPPTSRKKCDTLNTRAEPAPQTPPHSIARCTES